MIDYLLCFENEAAAMSALPAFVAEGIGGPEWDMTCSLPEVSAYRHLGFQVVEGENGPYLEQLREMIPGWYIIVARPTADPSLEGETCVLIADRDSGLVLHTITTPEDLATLRVEPVFAGSNYPFGAPVIATDEDLAKVAAWTPPS